MITCRL
ncbi:Protein of unknown function [Pyronema omphalodes CBS 100304]|nr:Protein of unknown function [Pyronema omphalodes CBS 100304]